MHVAGRLERVVRAEAARLPADPVDGVLGGDAGIGRAVVAGALEASLREVDRDDPFGAGEPAADDGAEPDEPAAEDDARRARLDVRGVERGADPRREPAREGRAALERGLGGNLRERDLRHHRVLGEGRSAHEVADRLAVTRESCRAVWEIPLPLHVTDRRAAVRAAASAVDALAALGREQRDDVIAGLHESDARPDALDDSCSFVPEHTRRVSGRIGTRGGVQIGVTHAAGGEPHEHLPVLRLGQVELLDDERLPEILEHCGADLHVRRLTRTAQLGDLDRAPRRR